MPSGEEELQETRPQLGRAVDAQQSEAERCQQQQDHDEQPQLGGRSVVEEDGHDNDGGEDKEHQELAKDLQDELLFIPGLGDSLEKLKLMETSSQGTEKQSTKSKMSLMNSKRAGRIMR